MANRAPDFFAQMTRADLDRLEAYARQPGRKIGELLRWMKNEGFSASKSAVDRWRRKFRESDRILEAAEFADSIHSAAAAYGTVDIGGAVNLQVAQRIMKALVRGGDRTDFGDLLKASQAVNQMSGSEIRWRQLLDARDRKQAEAVKAAEAAANRGGSGVDVVATIKAALGIAA